MRMFAIESRLAPLSAATLRELLMAKLRQNGEALPKDTLSPIANPYPRSPIPYRSATSRKSALTNCVGASSIIIAAGHTGFPVDITLMSAGENMGVG